MEIKDILALAHAGFNYEQIMAMANGPAQVQTQPVAQVQTQPVAQVQAQPVAQVQTQPVAQVQAQPVAQVQTQPVAQVQPYALPFGYYAQPAQNDIMEQLKALTGAVQTANINRSVQPAVRNADDVVASIINPPSKEA